MKGKTVSVQCHYKAGTNQMYKFPQPVEMKIIEVLQQDGTDRMFGYIEEELVYIEPSCIIKFIN